METPTNPPPLPLQPNQPRKEWVAVDLDGTLAHWDGYHGLDHIGDPILPMVNHVKQMLKEGKEVRIFTARVSPQFITWGTRDQKEAEDNLRRIVTAIYKFCVDFIGQPLAITCQKDGEMSAMYDDHCIQMVPNEGRRADGLPL